MATQKPSKPNVTLPDNFGGIKTPYSDAQIRDGYQDGVPEIVDGGNINYEKDALFQNTKYLRAVADTLVDMPIGKVLTVDSNNRFEYVDPVIIAIDEEYEDGTLTTKSPSVKQVRDSFEDIDGKITNCITEIPQDIKLELNDGTLTLKAGSKVYVPNGKNADGSLKFDSIVLPGDFKPTYSTNTDTCVNFIQFTNELGGGSSRYFNVSRAIYSGTTAPTSSTSSHLIWYDTANNLIKESQDYGATWFTDRKFSLPHSVVITSNGTVTSIDQVFNGFGYIGSTIFALPGVKGLIPNGRNADGSLKNTEFTLDKVLTFTQSYTQDCYFYFKNNGNTIAQVKQSDYYYDEIRNIQKTAREIQGVCIFASAREDAGVISNFAPKTAFHAVDYSDLYNELNNKFKVVSTLPANPVDGTFYYIPE